MPVFVQRTALKQTLHIVLVRGTLGVYGNLISLRLDYFFLTIFSFLRWTRSTGAHGHVCLEVPVREFGLWSVKLQKLLPHVLAMTGSC